MGRQQSNPSRREFLAAMAVTSAAMLVRPDQLWSAEVDPRVSQIVSRTIAVDMHNHVTIRFVNDDPADAAPDPDFDLAGEIKRSGFSAICQTYAVDRLVTKAGEYYKVHLQTLEFQDRLLASNHMRRALNMKDLETAHAHGQPIIVQSAEGAQFMEGRLERMEEAYKRGLRLVQPAHEQDDTVSPVGDVYTAAAHLGGLTAFGAKVVQECNRLGIVVDLAHGTSETVMGALKVATQPLIISHTGAGNGDIPADWRPRLISKEVARAVADAGGVVGIWWRLVDSMKEYVEGIKKMVDAVGVDHVGVGTDTNITSSYISPYTNRIWPDEDGGFFYALAGEMLKQGFTPDEISKIGGGNFCRVFAKVTAGHAETVAPPKS